MKMKNYYVLLVLCSFLSAFAAQQHNVIAANLGGIMVDLPRIDNAMMQAYSTTLSIINTPTQTKKVVGRTVGYDNKTHAALYKILEHAAERDMCERRALIEHIRDRIDEDLGIKTCWFRPLSGSVLSLGKARSLNVQDTVSELQKIESYMPAQCSSRAAYQSLEKRHWYFNALVEKLVDREVRKFTDLEDANIDALLDKRKIIPGLSQPLSEFITVSAQDQYVYDRDIGKCFVPSYQKYPGDIHDVSLFDGRHCYLGGHHTFVSVDNKYIKALCKQNHRDDCGRVMIWDVEKGCLSDVDEKTIVWQEKRKLRNQPDTIDYRDRDNLDGLTSCDQYRIDMEWYGGLLDIGRRWFALKLYVRSTLESSLSQDVFMQNKRNAAALIKLRDSKTVKNVKGIVGHNLKRLIDQQLQALMDQQVKNKGVHNDENEKLLCVDGAGL